MYLVLLVCALFISLMRSVNGAKLLNATSLLLLFGSTAGGGTGAVVIVLLTSIYASLWSYKLNLNFEVLNLIWKMVL